MGDPIQDAADLDALGVAVTNLARKSADTYTTHSVVVWKILSGDDPWDAAKLTKSVTKIWGQAAADATNASMMVQRLAALTGGP